MMIEKKEHINFVRNELKQYNFLKVILKGLEIRIDELVTTIENYQSSPVEFPDGAGDDPYWKSTLRDKLNGLEEKKTIFTNRIKSIENFFDCLDESDCDLIKNIYIENKTFAQESQRLSTTVRSLERYVERIMLQFKL